MERGGRRHHDIVQEERCGVVGGCKLPSESGVNIHKYPAVDASECENDGEGARNHANALFPSHVVNAPPHKRILGLHLSISIGLSTLSPLE